MYLPSLTPQTQTQLPSPLWFITHPYCHLKSGLLSTLPSSFSDCPAKTHTYFLVLCTAVPSTYNPFLLDSCSLGPPSEHQFKFHITFISALERSGFALLLIQNHYHSSFISILVSAIVDYSYTLEYKLSRRQRCIPLLSHNLTLIGQDGHVCNPSRMQKQWVLSLALVIQQELNKNKRTQVLTMHVLNENIRNNHKAYVFERYQAAKDSNQGHWLLKG